MSTRIAYLEAVVGADITSFRHEMRQVRRDLGAVGESMAGLRRTGKALTFAVTAPLVALGAGAIQSATQFDAAMRNINAIAGLTDSQLANLSERTLEWGSTIRSGPTSAAEALYTVFSAGVSDTETAFKIAEVGARTAEAGLADLENTTEALTGAMLAYGASADEAAHFSDVITQTVAVGVGEMNQFASAFGTVIPTAQIMGISFDEVGGALAFLTQRGMDASKASTALTGAIGKLLKPTEAMEGAFRQLGVSTGSELIEKFGGLEGAMVAIGEVAGDNEQALFDMFNEKRAFKAAANFINNLDQFQNSMEEFRGNVEGATMRAWESQMESFAAKVDLLKSALQGAAVAIGSELIPIVTPLIQKFTQFFTGIRELSPEIIQMAIAFSAVAAAVGPVLLILGNIINPIGIIAGLFTAAAIAVKEDFAGIGTAVQNAWDVLEGPLTNIKDGISDLFNILFGEEAGPESVGIEDLVAERLPGEISHTIDIVLEPGTSPAREWESGEFSDVLQDAFPTFGEFLEYLEKTDQRFFREGDTISVRVGTGLDPVSTGARLSSGIETSSISTSFSDRVNEAIDLALPRIRQGISDLFSEAGDWAINSGVPALSKAMGRAFGEVGIAIATGVSALWDMIFGGDKEIPDKGPSAADQVKDKIASPFAEGVAEAFAGQDFDSPAEMFFSSFATGLVTVLAGGFLLNKLTTLGFFDLFRSAVRGIFKRVATDKGVSEAVKTAGTTTGTNWIGIFGSAVAGVAVGVVISRELEKSGWNSQLREALGNALIPESEALGGEEAWNTAVENTIRSIMGMEPISPGVRPQVELDGVEFVVPEDAPEEVFTGDLALMMTQRFQNALSGQPIYMDNLQVEVTDLEDLSFLAKVWDDFESSLTESGRQELADHRWDFFDFVDVEFNIPEHKRAEALAEVRDLSVDLGIDFAGEWGNQIWQNRNQVTDEVANIGIVANDSWRASLEDMGATTATGFSSIRQQISSTTLEINGLISAMRSFDGMQVQAVVQVDNQAGPALSAGPTSGRAIGGPVFPGNVYESHFGSGEMFVPNVGGSVLPAGRQDQSGETVIEQNTYYINFNEVSDLDRMIFEARRRGLKFANA